MTAIWPWSSILWKYQYEFNQTAMVDLFTRVKSHWSVKPGAVSLESGSALSTVRVGVHDADQQPHFSLEVVDFNSWLEPIINNIWSDCNFSQMRSEVSKSWFNLHSRTGQTLEHFHNRTDLVVSAYICCDDDTGNIEFRDPLEYHKMGSSWHESQLWKEVKVKTNDVLIFPGWLNHRTQINETDTDRIVMTYNINGNSFI